MGKAADYLSRADLLYLKGLFVKAVAVYDLALLASPSFSAALQGKANALSAMGSDRRAVETRKRLEEVRGNPLEEGSAIHLVASPRTVHFIKDLWRGFLSRERRRREGDSSDIALFFSEALESLENRLDYARKHSEEFERHRFEEAEKAVTNLVNNAQYFTKPLDNEAIRFLRRVRDAKSDAERNRALKEMSEWGTGRLRGNVGLQIDALGIDPYRARAELAGVRVQYVYDPGSVGNPHISYDHENKVFYVYINPRIRMNAGFRNELSERLRNKIDDELIPVVEDNYELLMLYEHINEHEMRHVLALLLSKGRDSACGYFMEGLDHAMLLKVLELRAEMDGDESGYYEALTEVLPGFMWLQDREYFLMIDPAGVEHTLQGVTVLEKSRGMRIIDRVSEASDYVVNDIDVDHFFLTPCGNVKELRALIPGIQGHVDRLAARRESGVDPLLLTQDPLMHREFLDLMSRVVKVIATYEIAIQGTDLQAEALTCLQEIYDLFGERLEDGRPGDLEDSMMYWFYMYFSRRVPG